MATPVESIASALDLAVVRLRDGGGRIVGAGFLVGPREVLTCAHVVTAALGDTSARAVPQDVEIQLDFPLVDPTTIRTAKVAVWRPPEAGDASDIAGLELTGPPPQGAKPARLVAAGDVWEHAFRVLGFPARLDDGVWATGRLRGRQAGGWIQLEAIRETGYRIERGFSGAPVWDEELDGVVGMAVAADAQAERRAAYLIPTSALLDAWPMLSGRAIPPCPYRGLFAFREEDASRFFGREEISEQLVTRLTRSRLVGVVGPSGSGKSSLVFAGVVPQIRQLGGWAVADLRPGKAATPLIALASALLPLLEPTMTQVDRLRELPKLAGVLGERRLLEVVDHGLERVGADRLLLVVDQFEELFVQEPTVAAEFIDVLLQALAGQQARSPATLTIVLTLRADFLGQALEHPALAQDLQDSLLVIGRMTRDQLHRVIEGPAAGEVVYEPGLVDRILDDVGSEPGNLPLLEFALTLLWQQQAAHTLTHAAYEALGGVDGALARYAETIYLGELPEAEQEAARRVFVQLVRPGEATDHLRRIAHRSELDQERWRVAQRLAATRLVVTGRDPDGVETVEVVHEALISRWDRLRDWVEADRAFRAWQERLRNTIRQWEASGHDSGALLRGVALAEAERWLHQQPGDISATERSFVQTSRAFQTRTLRRLRSLVAVLAVLLLVASFLGAIAKQQQWRAERENKLAVSRALANEAGVKFLGQPDLSILLSVAAFRIADTREAREALQGELALRRDAEALLTGHTDGVLGSVFSPDGHTLASPSRDGTIGIWHVQRRHLVAKLEGQRGSVTGVAFSRDGRILAAANEDGRIGLWDVTRRTRLGELRTHGHPFRVAFSPDAGMLASGSDDGTIQLWDTRELPDVKAIAEIASLPGHDGGVLDLAFSPDGHTLASAGTDKLVRLWDVVQGANLPSLVGHTDPVSSVAFSPDGRRLVSASFDGTMRLWNVANHEKIATLDNRETPVTAVAFSPDGRTLVAGGGDATIRLWEVASRKQIALLIGHLYEVSDVAFSADGRTLASASFDKTIMLWAADHRDNLGYVETAHEIAFSPDGRTLAVASDAKEILLWDLPRRRLVARLKGHGGAVYGLAFSRDGRTLASASADKTVRLWDVARRARSHTFRIDAVPLSVALSPAADTLAAGSEDGKLRLWAVTTTKRIASVSAHPGGVRDLAFSPDGHTLASAGADRRIGLWDVAHPAKIVRIRSLVGHTDRVNSVAFSHDGHTLASGSSDTSIRLWDIAKPQPTAPLVGHAHEVTDVAFRPDGRTLASASGDSILFWDVATGARASGFESSFNRFSTVQEDYRLAYSPNGHLLATNDFGAIVLHSLEVREWVQRLCGIVGRDLTKAEWAEFVTGQDYETVCD